MSDTADAPRLVVDLAGGVAPWRQIRDQLVRLVADGALPVGARLPPIRQVAADLGLAPGTVARAYRELEADGTVRTGRRRGTVVAAVPRGVASGAPSTSAPLAAPARPVDLAAEYVARALARGDRPDAIVAAVRAALAAHDRQPDPVTAFRT